MSDPIKILLAEDNPTDVLLVRAALEQAEPADFSLCHVERLNETLDRLAAETFDVLLLDLGLPDSHGLQTLSEVRRRSSQIPVVVLTGLADEAAGLDALSAGAQDYLVKGHAEGRNLARAIRYAVERHQLLAAEQKARHDAEAASRAKDHFLAVVSHELRTPLTPVLLLTSALRQRNHLPADVLEDLETIHRHVDMEVRLISDLLDLVGIRAGKLQLQIRRIDLHDLIRDLVKTCEADAKAKSLDVVLRLEAGSAQIDADPARLQQALWNVLGNAIKFSKEMGSIVVRSLITNDDHLRVQIVDDGVGFEHDAMPRLFQPFEQGEQKLTRRFGGLGIGLAISKTIVDLHNGRIAASSRGGDRGATFSIDLPRTSRLATVQSCQPPAESEGNARSLHILVVEDDHSTADVLARILQSLGHNVSVEHSATAGLRAVEKDSYDLLLADIGLPDATGWDMMRQMQVIRPIRGIALSGFVTEEDSRKSFNAGFLCHLPKPVSIQQLAAKLAQFSAPPAAA